jgi:hypothetical protein
MEEPMVIIFFLLLLFLGIGLSVREYNLLTRLLVITGIVIMLFFLYIT